MESALPLWWERGADRVHGGFFEKLDDKLLPLEEPRRARLVARQIYVYATALEMGWTGPAREAAWHGLDFLRTRMLRGDGSVITSVKPDGTEVCGDFNLYDHAFVLLALATAARVLADGEMVHLGTKVRDHVLSRWKHPVAGFEESNPAAPPLRANPHMHLLEAFLAWGTVPDIDHGPWHRLAGEIADLALAQFIDSKTGALWELYDRAWRTLPERDGNLIEPGHQFEWAWLLGEWEKARPRSVDTSVIRRLMQIGERHGVDPGRGIAVNGLGADLTTRDADARLWPQTERIKAWHAARDMERRDAAIQGLLRYFQGKPAGLWRETIRADGSFAPEPARASSLYHIVCAVRTLQT